MSLAHHESETFAEELDNWLNRSPFLAIALFAHLIAFFAVNAIPWDQFREPENDVAVVLARPPVDEFVAPEPPVEPEPLPLDPLPVDEVRVTESAVSESDSIADSDADVPFANENPFASEPSMISAVGLAGPAGAGGPLGGRGQRASALSSELHTAIRAGLDWLAEHQSPSGAWEARDFADNCGREGGELANGAGDALHDVGVTGLALLAFLGLGHSTVEGDYIDTVRAGVRWLNQNQDDRTGLVGPDTSLEFLYDQAVATLALAEAFASSGNPLVERAAQRAVDACIDAQNPYSGWRYDLPPSGTSDTSVTGWMVLALTVARKSGLAVGDSSFDGALAWLDEATDPRTGRVGYDRRGGPSSRLARLDVLYPPERTEAMTGTGVLSRVFVHHLRGTDPARDPLVLLGAERVMERLPEWDPLGGSGGDSGWDEGDAGSSNDMYGWYACSYALHQLGGRDWDRWRRRLEPMILANQRTSPPCLEGSWDPGGPWGSVGGRVYSTAILLLCLETTVRYERP